MLSSLLTAINLQLLHGRHLYCIQSTCLSRQKPSSTILVSSLLLSTDYSETNTSSKPHGTSEDKIQAQYNNVIVKLSMVLYLDHQTGFGPNCCDLTPRCQQKQWCCVTDPCPAEYNTDHNLMYVRTKLSIYYRWLSKETTYCGRFHGFPKRHRRDS